MEKPNKFVMRSVDRATEDLSEAFSSIWTARPNLPLIRKQARRRWIIRWSLFWLVWFAILAVAMWTR